MMKVDLWNLLGRVKMKLDEQLEILMGKSDPTPSSDIDKTFEEGVVGDGGVLRIEEEGELGLGAYPLSDEDKSLIEMEDMLDGEDPMQVSADDYFTPEPSLDDQDHAGNLRMFLDDVAVLEGGFVNDPDDDGGPTNRGVTLDTYRNYVDPDATIDDLKKITKEDAEKVFVEEYFYGMGADRLPEGLQGLVFDMNILHGPGNTAKMVQRAINDSTDNKVAVDGHIGKNTIKALTSSDLSAVYDEILEEREDFVREFARRKPKKRKYLRGWLNRIHSFKDKKSV